MTRWVHPPELQRTRQRGEFDPVVEGARHGLGRDAALAIWKRALLDAIGAEGRHDDARAQRRFHELLMRGDGQRPAVGRLTRVGVELDRVVTPFADADAMQPRVPGRDTLVALEARHRPDPPTAVMRSAERTEIDAEARDLVTRARHGGVSLDESLRSRLEAALSARLDRVRVHTGSDADTAARALSARAFAIGNDIFFRSGTYDPQSREGQRLIAHEVAHTVQASDAPASTGAPLAVSEPNDALEQEADAFANHFVDHSAAIAVDPAAAAHAPVLTHAALSPMVRRVAMGNDGRLSSRRQAVVRAAAEIVSRLVDQTTGPDSFQQKWNAFWNGIGKNITQRPSLEAYRAAVKGRIVHDMDISQDRDISKFVKEEVAMPLERQTAAVTKLGSQNTYIRQFAIDQGIDSVATLLLHESFHGAGVSMGGPLLLYEPIMHAFEASAGFPMMNGGADIVTIEQKRSGDVDVDVTIRYDLREIGGDPLPTKIEIQIVDQDNGQVAYQEDGSGQRKPVRESIPRKPGMGRWLWHARNPSIVKYAVRIVDKTTDTLMGSKDFETDPRCIIGVSTIHCENE